MAIELQNCSALKIANSDLPVVKLLINILTFPVVYESEKGLLFEKIKKSKAITGNKTNKVRLWLIFNLKKKCARSIPRSSKKQIRNVIDKVSKPDKQQISIAISLKKG